MYTSSGCEGAEGPEVTNGDGVVERLLESVPRDHPSAHVLKRFLATRSSAELNVGLGRDGEHMDIVTTQVPWVLPFGGDRENLDRYTKIALQTLAPPGMRGVLLREAYNAGVHKVLESAKALPGSSVYFTLPAGHPLALPGVRQSVARLTLTVSSLWTEPLPSLRAASARETRTHARLPAARSPHALPPWTPKGTLQRLAQDSGKGGRPAYTTPLMGTLCLTLEVLSANRLMVSQGYGAAGVRAGIAAAVAAAAAAGSPRPGSAQLLAAGLGATPKPPPVLVVHTGRLRLGAVPVLVGSDMCALRDASDATWLMAGHAAGDTGGYFYTGKPLVHDFLPGKASNFAGVTPGPRAGTFELMVYSSKKPPHDQLSLPGVGTYQIIIRLSEAGLLTLHASVLGDEGLPLTLVMRACGAATDAALVAALELPRAKDQPGECPLRRLEAQCNVMGTLAVESLWVKHGGLPNKATVLASITDAVTAHRARPLCAPKAPAGLAGGKHPSGLTLEQARALAFVGKAFASRTPGKPLEVVPIDELEYGAGGAGVGAGAPAGSGSGGDTVVGTMKPKPKKRERPVGEDEANEFEDADADADADAFAGADALEGADADARIHEDVHMESELEDEAGAMDCNVPVNEPGMCWADDSEAVDAFLCANAQLVASGILCLWQMFMTCVDAPAPGAVGNDAGIPDGVLDALATKGASLAALGRQLLGVAVCGGPMTVRSDATHGTMMGFNEFFGAVFPQNVAHCLLITAKSVLGGSSNPGSALTPPRGGSPFQLVLEEAAAAVSSTALPRTKSRGRARLGVGADVGSGSGSGSGMRYPELSAALTAIFSGSGSKALSFTAWTEFALASHQWSVGPTGAPPKQMFMPLGSQNDTHADSSLYAYRRANTSTHTNQRTIPGSQFEQRCMVTTPDNENSGLVGEVPVTTVISPVRSAATTPGGARDAAGHPLPITPAGLRAALNAAGFPVGAPGCPEGWVGTAWRLVADGVPVGVFLGGEPSTSKAVALAAARALDAARSGVGHPALVALGLGLFSDVGWHTPAQPAFNLPVADPRFGPEPVVHLETASGRTMQVHVRLEGGRVPLASRERFVAQEARLRASAAEASEWTAFRNAVVLQAVTSAARAAGRQLPYGGVSSQVLVAARGTALEEAALRHAAPRVRAQLAAAGVAPADPKWVPAVVPGWFGFQYDVGPEVRAALAPAACLYGALTGHGAPLITRGPNSVGWVALSLVDVAAPPCAHVSPGTGLCVQSEAGGSMESDSDSDLESDLESESDPEPLVALEDLPDRYTSSMAESAVRFGGAASQIPGGTGTTPARFTFTSMQARQYLKPHQPNGWGMSTFLGFRTLMYAPRGLASCRGACSPQALNTYAAFRGLVAKAVGELVAQGRVHPDTVAAAVAQVRRELLDGALEEGQAAPGALAGAPLMLSVMQWASSSGLQCADNDAIVLGDVTQLQLYGVRTQLQQMSSKSTVPCAMDGVVFRQGIAAVNPDTGEVDRNPWATVEAVAPVIAKALMAGDVRTAANVGSGSGSGSGPGAGAEPVDQLIAGMGALGRQWAMGGADAPRSMELVVGPGARVSLSVLAVEAMPTAYALPGVVEAGPQAEAAGLRVGPEFVNATDGGVGWAALSRAVKVGPSGQPVPVSASASRSGGSGGNAPPPPGVTGICEVVFVQTLAERRALFVELMGFQNSATAGVVDVGAQRTPGGVLAVNTWVRPVEGVSLFLPGTRINLRVITRVEVEYRVVRVHAVRQGSLLTHVAARVSDVTWATNSAGVQTLVVDMVRCMPSMPGDKWTTQLSQKTVPGPFMPLGAMPFDPCSGAVTVVIQDPNAYNTRKVPPTLMGYVAANRTLAGGLPFIIMSLDRRLPQVVGGIPLSSPQPELYPGGPSLPWVATAEGLGPGLGHGPGPEPEPESGSVSGSGSGLGARGAARHLGAWAGIPVPGGRAATQLPVGSLNTQRTVLIPGRSLGCVGGPAFDQVFPGFLVGGGVATMYSTKHVNTTVAKASSSCNEGPGANQDQVRQGNMEFTCLQNHGAAGALKVQFRERAKSPMVICNRCGMTQFTRHSEGTLACTSGVCWEGKASAGLSNFTVGTVPTKLQQLVHFLGGMGISMTFETGNSHPGLDLGHPVGSK